MRLAEEVVSGKLPLDPGANRDEVEAALLALPGIGPWTAAYLRMRALSDPDTFLAGDLGLRDALKALGEAGGPTQALPRVKAGRMARLRSAPPIGLAGHFSPRGPRADRLTREMTPNATCCHYR